ncbi:MAG: metallophosphoesterase family protein [Pseudomonadota bacterium]
MTIYAVGDIHGHIEKLDHALALIEADGGRDAEVVFVGDYIDRGPDSRAVIERLATGQAKGRRWTCLKGNHDRLMEWFFHPDGPKQDPHILVGYHWLHKAFGGAETLASYGVDVPERIRLGDLAARARKHVPQDHIAFLRGLPLFHEAGPLLFVHAGIRPGVPLAEQAENDLVWIRDGFLDDETVHPHLVVHGHTPVETPTHFRNRVAIDSGAAFGRPLVPVACEGREIYALTEAGRVALTARGSPA